MATGRTFPAALGGTPQNYRKLAADELRDWRNDMRSATGNYAATCRDEIRIIRDRVRKECAAGIHEALSVIAIVIKIK